MDIEQMETDIESIKEEIQQNYTKDINVAFIESLLDRLEENLTKHNSRKNQSAKKKNTMSKEEYNHIFNTPHHIGDKAD